MNIGQNQYGMPYQNSWQTGYPQANVNHMGRGVKEDEEAAEKSEETKSYREQILEKMAEMEENIRKGTIQPKFQIGAQAYTIAEWEELLQKFDAAEEVLREEVRAQIEEAEKQAEEEALKRAVLYGEDDPNNVTRVSDSVPSQTASAASAIETAAAGTTTTAEMAAAETVAAASILAEPAAAAPETTTVSETEDVKAAEETAALLTEEIVKCTYPTDDPKEKHWYVTCFGPDGVSCKEGYFDGTKWVTKDLWSFSYTEKGQYEKILAFLERFASDANLRFAAHENFWQDFLAGKIDEDDFVAFFKTTKDGVPDYTYEKNGSTYIDREKVKYAKYMNTPGSRLYTEAELELILRGIIHENTKNMHKISDHHGAMTIPDGVGKQADSGEDDLQTQIVTKPDGSTVLQITTTYGVMELEITQAQRFGLLLDLGRNYNPTASPINPAPTAG